LGVVGVEVANTYPLTRRPANASWPHMSSFILKTLTRPTNPRLQPHGRVLSTLRRSQPLAPLWTSKFPCAAACLPHATLASSPTCHLAMPPSPAGAGCFAMHAIAPLPHVALQRTPPEPDHATSRCSSITPLSPNVL
jgi:hypothetical protein